MKQIILSIVVIFSISLSVVFANGEFLSDPEAQVTLKKEFPRAEHIKWSQEGEGTKASFVLDGIGVIAFFGKDGELLGSARNILYHQLPMAVLTSFEKRFDKATISGIGITEITNSGITRYMFPLEYNGERYSATLYYDGAIGNIKKLKR
jgi:hypothetical protein